MRELRPDHPALKGRTIFLQTVKGPGDVRRLLQPASNNSKLGDGKRCVTKGKWKGMPMYQLTLEERKTCPRSCEQWRNCYGNNMPFANRVDHSSTKFFSSLSLELSSLSSLHPGGFVVRLHVLGDFFSVPYVRFWRSQMKRIPALRIFGYTHRLPGSAIGKEITRMNSEGSWVRWSDAGGPMSANTDQPGQGPAEGITCPEQTGKTASCLTCGLCWSTTLPIRFMPH